MGINPNQINLVDNTGSSALEGSVIVSKNTGEHVWSSNSSASIKLPSGNIAQRNAVAYDGYLRFNIETKSIELFSESAPVGWKSVGQLTPDGTNLAPTFSFSTEPTSGFYRPGLNQIGLSINGSPKSIWSNAGQTINGALTVTGSISASAITFTGPNAALSAKPTETLSMLDGASNATLGGSFTYAGTSKSGMIVDYVLRRGANYKVGTFIVANSATSATITDTLSASSGALGVTFTVNTVSGTVQVLYSSTPTGTAIVGKFSVREWGVF